MTATTMKGVRKQQTMDASYFLEGKDDIESASLELTFAQSQKDWAAVARAAKFIQMGLRRLHQFELGEIRPQSITLTEEQRKMLSEPEDDVD